MKAMDTKQVEHRLIRIIIGPRPIDQNTITADTTFAQLEVDSFDAISIVFDIEAEFGIKVPDSEVYELRTVGDVFTGVKRLLNEQNRLINP